MKPPNHNKRNGLWRELLAALGAGALAASLAGCGGSTPQQPSEPDPMAPIAVSGYEFEEGQGDATAAAVVQAYDTSAWARPPEVISEDFSDGPGPFWTFEDELSSAKVVEGALRVTNSDPAYTNGSYAELEAPADRVVLTASAAVTRALQEGEGPTLYLWLGDGMGYLMSVDGTRAYLLQQANSDADPVLLDSADLPGPLDTPVTLTLVFSARDPKTGLVGGVNGQPLLEHEGAEATVDTVGLSAASMGTEVAVDYDDVTVYALDEGASQEAFTGQREFVVTKDGTEVGALVILEPAECLRSLKDFADEKCVPGLLPAAAPEGMTTESQTIAGASVVTGQQGTSTFWLWMSEGELHLVTAPDAASGGTFVEAYINASQPASSA
jgi:hypothetical protein